MDEDFLAYFHHVVMVVARREKKKRKRNASLLKSLLPFPYKKDTWNRKTVTGVKSDKTLHWLS